MARRPTSAKVPPPQRSTGASVRPSVPFSGALRCFPVALRVLIGRSILAGKRAVKPTKFTKDMDADKELTKFINQCNEKKAASLASKEGGDLSILKADVDPSNSN
jgi:hypothetical protein